MEQDKKLKNFIKTTIREFLNENIDDEIKDIKDMIELYDDNYNVYRRRYLQTQSDEDRQKMNKWFKLKNEQEKLLKDIRG
jgi:hypothetical protein